LVQGKSNDKSNENEDWGKSEEEMEMSFEIEPTAGGLGSRMSILGSRGKKTTENK
jgi:hypothetical protein